MRRALIFAVALAVLAASAGCSNTTVIEPGGSGAVPAGKVRVVYYGHGMFLVEDRMNSVLVDPYGPDIGYIVPKVKAKVVLVSDPKSAVSSLGLKGNPKVVTGLGEQWLGSFVVTGIPSGGIKSGGAKQGSNTIYYWKMGGLTFAHMGDFGQRTLTEQQRVLLRGVDVLMMPIGGRSTVDADKAADLTNAIRPRVVIPMQYKTKAVVLDLAAVESFTSRFTRIRRIGESALLSPQTLPSETEVWAMRYSKQ